MDMSSTTGYREEQVSYHVVMSARWKERTPALDSKDLNLGVWLSLFHSYVMLVSSIL